MAPRRRSRKSKKKKEHGTRMDAALDAMRQLGFEDRLIEDTVEELLEVYDGIQGWPFIEEASYKLLIETLLTKPSPAEEKDSLEDNARKDDVGEPSSNATDTPAIGITEEFEDTTLPTEIVGGDVQGNVESTFVSTPIIEFSKTPDKLPSRRRKPCHGWIGDSDDDAAEPIEFPIPPLAKQLEKLRVPSEASQSGIRRWRKIKTMAELLKDREGVIPSPNN